MRLAAVLLVPCAAAGCACEKAIDLQGRADGDSTSDSGVDGWLDASDPSVDPLPDTAEAVADPGDDVSDSSTDSTYDPDFSEGCLPEGESWIHFIVDGSSWPSEESMDLDLQCRVVWIMTSSWNTSFELDCLNGAGSAEGHILEIATYPDHTYSEYPDVHDNDQLIFRYRAERDPGTEAVASRWASLASTDGDLLFAVTDAETISPPGEMSAEFFHPLNVEPWFGLCPFEPAECGDPWRAAVTVWGTEGSAVVFDGGVGSIGGLYYILVGEAEELLASGECGIHEEARFDLLIFRIRP
jgi:hypothetical protein